MYCVIKELKDNYFLKDLGGYFRQINSSHAGAQLWMQRGLLVLFCGLPEEALNCFQKASLQDETCAFVHWCISYTSGDLLLRLAGLPTLDNKQPDFKSLDAAVLAELDALRTQATSHGRRAAELLEIKGNPASAVERELVGILPTRNDYSGLAQLPHAQSQWTQALNRLMAKHEADADILCWALDAAAKQPGKTDVRANLDDALARFPNHPGLLTQFCASLETAGEEAARANLSRVLPLSALWPQLGQAIASPARVLCVIGSYVEAVPMLERAIRADLMFAAGASRERACGVWRLSKYSVLCLCACLSGQQEAALKAAFDVFGEVGNDASAPNQKMQLEPCLALRFHVFLRFGRWEQALREPLPAPGVTPFVLAIQRYARTVALACLERPDAAATELALLLEASKDVPPSALFGGVPAALFLKLAELVASAHVAYRQSQKEQALELLRNAVRVQDAIKTADRLAAKLLWPEPVRHALSALLMACNQMAEARALCTEDLLSFPTNVWSLFGLWACAHAAAPQSEVTARAWARLQSGVRRCDVLLAAPHFCHIAAVRNKRQEAEARLTLYVADRSGLTNPGGKFLVVGHPALGDEGMEVVSISLLLMSKIDVLTVLCVDCQITRSPTGHKVQLSVFNHIARVELHGEETCFFFDGRLYRSEAREGVSSFEDPALFDEHVWASCKVQSILGSVYLAKSDRRSGWTEFCGAYRLLNRGRAGCACSTPCLGAPARATCRRCASCTT